jgi:hypothetical protein
MAPFFLDVWMEAAQLDEEKLPKAEKKTLFFIPTNDNILASAGEKTAKEASEA